MSAHSETLQHATAALLCTACSSPQGVLELPCWVACSLRQCCARTYGHAHTHTIAAGHCGAPAPRGHPNLCGHRGHGVQQHMGAQPQHPQGEHQNPGIRGRRRALWAWDPRLDRIPKAVISVPPGPSAWCLRMQSRPARPRLAGGWVLLVLEQERPLLGGGWVLLVLVQKRPLLGGGWVLLAFVRKRPL